MCPIVVDRFECASGMPEALAALGVEVAVEALEAGDYDLGSRVLVERKTVVDLHLSVQRGRFWRQIDELRRAARLPHLLIEGADARHRFDLAERHPWRLCGRRRPRRSADPER